MRYVTITGRLLKRRGRERSTPSSSSSSASPSLSMSDVRSVTDRIDVRLSSSPKNCSGGADRTARIAVSPLAERSVLVGALGVGADRGSLVKELIQTSSGKKRQFFTCFVRVRGWRRRPPLPVRRAGPTNSTDSRQCPFRREQCANHCRRDRVDVRRPT